MISWAGLSIAERRVRFHRQFPGSKISIYYLRKAYREARIRKKKIRRTKIITPAHKAKIRLEALEVSKILQRHIDEGYRIIYLDEFMTTKSTMPTHDWTPVNQPFQIDYKLYHKKTIASIIGISREAGVELIMNFPSSVNSDKYALYLRALRQKHPGEKLALFVDQLMVHRSKATLPVLEELEITNILNAPYSPNYNPAEGAIAICKRQIKKERLRALAMNRDKDLGQIITECALNV